MQELFIHIGTHKTGTTTIQAALAASAKQLLRKQGLLYPESGRPESNSDSRFGHHVLARSVGNPLGSLEQLVWNGLFDECERSGAKRVLISAEHFSSFDPEQIAELRKLLSGFARVTIVLYLRNPLRFLLSAYRQQTNGHKAISCSFEQFVIENAARCDYENLVLKWAEAFGENALKVRVYDYVVRSSGLLADFARTVGFPELPADEAFKLNVSSSMGVTRIISALNVLKKWVPHRHWQQTRQAILRSGLNQWTFLDHCIGAAATASSTALIHQAFQVGKAEQLRKFLIPEELNCLRVDDRKPKPASPVGLAKEAGATVRW